MHEVGIKSANDEELQIILNYLMNMHEVGTQKSANDENLSKIIFEYA